MFKSEWIKNKRNEELLAEMWGDYIDWEKRRKGENGWLVRQLKKYNCHKIFDAALGDGCDSIYLIKEGFDVTSNEISEAFIKKAKENAKREGVRLKILKLDWRKLTKKIPKETFDAVLCLGNSLTCLFKYEDRLAALKQFWTILKKGGILIIDKRHYRPILDNRERVLKGYFHYSGKYVYCGKYVHSKPVEIREDRITFEVSDKRTGKKAYFTVYPFTHWELMYFLKMIGFKKIIEYSDYQYGYNPKADFFMYVCQK
jgi:SAM-dependent methyltransferase